MLDDPDFDRLLAASVPPARTGRRFSVQAHFQDGSARMHTRDGGHAVDHAQEAMEALGLPGRVLVRPLAAEGDA